MATLQCAESWLALLLAALLLVLTEITTCTAQQDFSSADAPTAIRFGRRKTLVMPGLPPVSTGLLLPLTPNMWSSIRRRNPTFRHASVGFVPPGNGSGNESAAPRWNYLDRVDWQQRRMVRPVQNQASCAACWAIAAVAAVESLYAIVTNSPPPAISAQRLLECAPNTPRTPPTTPPTTSPSPPATTAIAAPSVDGSLSDYLATFESTQKQSSVNGSLNDYLASQIALLESAQNSQSPAAAAAAADASSLNGGGGESGSEGDDTESQQRWMDGCDGGWSAEAFDYMAFSALPAAAGAPFIGARGTRNSSRVALCLQQQQQQQQQQAVPPPLVYADNSVPFSRRPPYKGPFSVTMFEETALEGYLGMILALQRQPVVAAIEADQPSFIKYDGSFIYSDPACFINGVVDHSVLVIGYDLAAPTPHWLILNSWGSWWGSWGVMRLAMSGGDGICGIHSMPALYPVIKTPDPCFPVNPCGGGRCAVDAGTGGNTCECPEGFRAVVNIDGSQSCALAARCAFSMVNPCDSGTCIDSSSSKGGYSCLCPPPAERGNNTDGTQTCIVPPAALASSNGENGNDGNNANNGGGSNSGGSSDSGSGSGSSIAPSVRRVRVLEGMTCGMLALTFRLTVEQLQQTNPGIDCSRLEIGTTVMVNTSAAAVACSLSYAASPGDTCALIVGLFNTSTATLLFLNPQLDCSLPFATSQSLCVAAPSTPLPCRCTQWYTLQPNDTCRILMPSVACPPLPPAHFFALNPGLSCSHLEQPNAAGVEVCTRAAPNLTGATNCFTGEVYYATRGDTCARILAIYFSYSARLMAQYNYGAVCRMPLFVGQRFCLPPLERKGTVLYPPSSRQ